MVSTYGQIDTHPPSHARLLTRSRTQVPDDAKDLVKKLIRLKPEERLGGQVAGDLSAVKAHPFFSSIPFDRLPELPELPPVRVPTLAELCIRAAANRVTLRDQPRRR